MEVGDVAERRVILERERLPDKRLFACLAEFHEINSERFAGLARVCKHGLHVRTICLILGMEARIDAISQRVVSLLVVLAIRTTVVIVFVRFPMLFVMTTLGVSLSVIVVAR